MKNKEHVRNDLDHELEFCLRTLFRSLRKDMNELFTNHMPSNEFSVLRSLRNSSPQMASEIANELKVSSSHITAVTDRLVGKNYIERVRSNSDRRIVYLEITDEGRNIANQLDEIKFDYLAKRFSRLSEDEMKNMISLLSKLLD